MRFILERRVNDARIDLARTGTGCQSDAFPRFFKLTPSRAIFLFTWRQKSQFSVTTTAGAMMTQMLKTIEWSSHSFFTPAVAAANTPKPSANDHSITQISPSMVSSVERVTGFGFCDGSDCMAA